MFLHAFAYFGLVYPYLHFLCFNLLVFVLFSFPMKRILGLDFR